MSDQRIELADGKYDVVIGEQGVRVYLYGYPMKRLSFGGEQLVCALVEEILRSRKEGAA